jgi:GNAT superfamily N-acetyltransferase
MYQPNSSPLDLDGEPMPIEAFHDLCHVPGFKYEYTRGHADISVQRSAHATVAAPARRILGHMESSLPDDIGVEPAFGTSVDALETLWVNTFVGMSDYYGWAVEDIRDDARVSLDSLYGDGDALHPASLVARRNGDLVAALLVNENKTRPLIEVLCVLRNLRRRGIGRALVHRVARRLDDSGGEGTSGEGETTLCSGYLLANRGSALWHEAVGFIELPSVSVMTHRYRCLQHNLKRGLVPDPFWAQRRKENLQERLNQMKEEWQDESAAHSPSRWLSPEADVNGGERIDAYLDAYAERVAQLERV